jgi:membrane fusion protein, heavy metal efflux system
MSMRTMISTRVGPLSSRIPDPGSFLVPLVVAFLASAGCSGERGVPGRTTEAARSASAETHPEEENALHLAEDMLRDLRTSTAVVTERSGLQEVVVLGAVAVDQERYAEVAPPTGGQIVALLAAANTAVDRGTPLAQLRSIELGRARAALLSAEARRDLARQTLERKQALARERIVPQREVLEAEATFRAAEADAGATAAGLQALGISDEGAASDTSLFNLRSPIPGRVLERRAVLGTYADPSVPLFTIADLSRVWVVAQAFERDAVNVPVGSTAHVTLAALPGQEFDGRVALVGREVDEGSRTIPVRVELRNPTGVLRPGMSASARLEVSGQTTRILAVPAAALQRVGDRWLVFVPRGQAEFEMRPVGRGRDLGMDVEVVSGLEAGDTVVVEGAFLLKAEAEKKAGGVDEHGH